jgi:hypothetical protein
MPSARKSAKAESPSLLAGGNPQIAKGYGDAVVQQWIAAAPGWKGEVSARIDALVVHAVPGVKKAVKWNSPFYGMEEGLWFASLHCFTKFVRVTFFKGAALEPPPAGTSKYPEVRYYDVYEGALDDKQFSVWAKQAAKLPGEKL